MPKAYLGRSKVDFSNNAQPGTQGYRVVLETTEIRDLPRHVIMARDVNGMPLVGFHGAGGVESIKLAHWRGQLSDVHTRPRDDYHTICFHQSGGSVRRADTPGQALTPGTAFVQPNYDEAVFNSDGNLEYFHIYLQVDALNALGEELDIYTSSDDRLPVDFACRDVEFLSEVTSFIRAMRGEDVPSAVELEEWTQRLGTALLQYTKAEVKDKLARMPRSGLSPTQTQRIVDYVEDRINARITLATMSEMAGMSQFQFMRAFRMETGFSPHQYLLERRVARAKQLLQAGGDSIADISYEVGFSSQAHMTHVFRKRVGVTPGTFRRIRAS